MIYAAIVIISVILIGLAAASAYNESSDWFVTGIFGGILLVGLTLCIASLIEEPTPAPIDVYRGRTTLQITYKDSTAIDTVVVFKNEFMEENKQPKH